MLGQKDTHEMIQRSVERRAEHEAWIEEQAMFRGLGAGRSLTLSATFMLFLLSFVAYLTI